MTLDVRKLKDRATEAYEKGKHKKAAELFLQLSRAEPAEPGWPHRAGELHRKLGRNAEAVRLLGAAAEGYTRQGFLLKGVAVCKLILAIDPGHEPTQAQLAALLAKLARPRTATGVAGAPAAPAAALARVMLVPGTAAPPAPEPAAAAPPAAATPPAPAPEAAAPAPEPALPPPAAGEVFALGDEDPLESLPLGRLVPGARPSPAMPELAIEIPLEEDDEVTPVLAVEPPPAPASIEAALLSAEPLVELPTASAALPRIPLFSSLSPDQLRRLVERVTVMEAVDGEVIVAEGEPGDALYVLVRGAVTIDRGTGASRVRLARLIEGAFFGEIALIAGSPRTATVVADGDATLLRISHEVFRELIAESAEVLKVLLGFFRSNLVSQLLASSPLFAPFTPEERDALVGRFRFLEIEPDATVIRRGEPAPGLLVLLSGALSVSAVRDGTEGAVAPLAAGDLCGVRSLLARTPSTVTVRAARKCWALLLPHEQFHEIILTHPQVLAFVSQLADEHQRVEIGGAGAPPSGDGHVPVY